MKKLLVSLLLGTALIVGFLNLNKATPQPISRNPGTNPTTVKIIKPGQPEQNKKIMEEAKKRAAA